MLKIIHSIIIGFFAVLLVALLNKRSLAITVYLLAGAQLAMIINDPIINIWAYKVSSTSLVLIFFQLFLFGAGFLALSFIDIDGGTVTSELTLIVARSVGFSVLCAVSSIAYLKIFWIESRALMVFSVIITYAVAVFCILTMVHNKQSINDKLNDLLKE